MARLKKKPRAKRKYTKKSKYGLDQIVTKVRKLIKRLSSAQLTALITALSLGTIVSVSLFIVSFRPHIKYNANVSSPEETILQAQFKKLNPMPLSKRIIYWSYFIKKNPTLLSSISFFSKSIDKDIVPYVPKDFDCTTYVETVMALARAAHSSQIAAEILTIRYKNGEPSFLNRNHFPEADWIPHNVQAGILRDVTSNIAHAGYTEPSFAYKTVYKGEWLQSKLKKLKNRSLASKSSTAQALNRTNSVPGNQSTDVVLPYIPLDDVSELLPYIPTGSVINLVHEDAPGKPVLISHQGILIQTKHGAYLRHARSKSGIRDNLLLPYLEKQSNRSWRVVGINVNALLE